VEADRFRNWLARKLRGTRYAEVNTADGDIDKVAKRLGVDPELLLEVRAQALVDLHSRGYARPLSNKPKHREQLKQDWRANNRGLYQLKMWIPSECFAAWKEECARRGVKGAALLRSITHSYLLRKYEPEPQRHWRLGDKVFPNSREDLRSEKAAVPRGVSRALMRRAATKNTKATMIVRALMMEAIQGRHMGVPLVTAAMMFEDETRYYLGESTKP